MIEHCPRRTDVGVFAMGAMPPSDYREYSAHIVDCQSCSAELAELVPVLAVLEAVGSETVVDHTVSVDTVPDTLRAKVLASFDRQSAEALLADVRGSRKIESIDLTKPSWEVADYGLPDSDLINDAAPPGKHVAERRARSWKLFAIAAGVVALVVSALALVSRGDSDAITTRYQLVALERDPLIATAVLSTMNDTTIAEFVVDGTVPGEIYFAWFEDPEGTRVGLGSFRGAEGRVKFRGQTGVARKDLVAVGATTRNGEARTDRMRAELPRS